MADKPKLKYEKPVSIDMGRVSPVLGDTCSSGIGASDCSAGTDNKTIPACSPSGTNASDTCQNGSNAGSFCYPVGDSANMGCFAGDGH